MRSGGLVVRVVPIGAGDMEALRDGLVMGGLQQMGSIRHTGGFGFIRLGHSFFGVENFIGGVYQKRVTGYNNYGRRPGLPRKSYYVRMRYYRPSNPRTDLQQANRMKFKEASQAWGALSDSDKAMWASRAYKIGRRPHGLFISRYLRYDGDVS